jgi:hypothetical protein
VEERREVTAGYVQPPVVIACENDADPPGQPCQTSTDKQMIFYDSPFLLPLKADSL